MKKSVYTYGIIAGIIVSLMLLLHKIDSPSLLEYGELIGYTSMLIAFSTIVFAVKDLHAKNPNTSFKNSFLMGLKITLIASLIYTFAWMIISSTSGEDLMAEYYAKSIEKLQASNLSEQEIQAKIEEMESFREMYKNPLVKIAVTLMEIFPVGLVVSLLTAFVFKIRKSNT